MKEERPRSADISKMNAEEKSEEVRNLREQIVETFKTQMKLRRKLMEIDAHLLGEPTRILFENIIITLIIALHLINNYFLNNQELCELNINI